MAHCSQEGGAAHVGAVLRASSGRPRHHSCVLSNKTTPWRLRGHAYLLGGGARRRAAADDVVLIGDAAGLAYPQSGEGIRPAIESGLLAAAAILNARGQYTAGRLARYERDLAARFDTAPLVRALSRVVPKGVAAALAQPLIGVPWFVRHVVLDRWFLREAERALAG